MHTIFKFVALLRTSERADTALLIHLLTVLVLMLFLYVSVADLGFFRVRVTLGTR